MSSHPYLRPIAPPPPPKTPAQRLMESTQRLAATVQRINARHRVAKGSHHHSWASRDYLDGVNCKCLQCPVNERGVCGTPSQSRLNADGQCETWIDFKSKPAVKPPPRCRICGGLVKQQGTMMGGSIWIHDGEKLSHEVEI